MIPPERCPKCGRPACLVKGRRGPEHVPQVDPKDPRRQREVSSRLYVCPAPAGCGYTFLVPWVRLDPVPSALRYLPSRGGRRSPSRDPKRVRAAR